MAKPRLRFQWLLIVPVVLLLAGASAQAKIDSFFVAIGPNNEFLEGGGSPPSADGAGRWYFYPNTVWWSQWFYSGPYAPGRKQAVDISLIVVPIQPELPCIVQVSYSCATPAWSQLGSSHPPLPVYFKNAADETRFIQRRIFYTSQLASDSEPITVKNHLEIPYYNPQWVSIDVRGRNFVVLDGSLDHRSAVRGAGEVSLASEPGVTAGTGACCLGTTCKDDMDEQTCVAERGTFMGPGTICETTNCAEPPPSKEACCLPDGNCQNLTDAQCLALNGVPRGRGTTCATTNCPQPPPPETGACCHKLNGVNWILTCTNETALGCSLYSGIFYGYGSSCQGTGGGICGLLTPMEACCMPDGSCQALTPEQCINSFGTAQGNATKCSTANCAQPPPSGPQACCVPGQGCLNKTAVDCTAVGGTPQGSGTTCQTTTCAAPPGQQTEACCVLGQGCLDKKPADCTAVGGTPQGSGTTCQTTTCAAPPGQQTEACCVPGQGCLDKTPADCAAAGGTPQGPGTTCQTTECQWACCFENGNCENLTTTQCSSKGGASFYSYMKTCQQISCPKMEACCFSGGCQDLTSEACSFFGGNPQGAGTSCATVNCAQPPPSGTQACCLPDGSCQNLTWVQCKDAGGSPQGAATSCATTNCAQPPPPSQTEACCMPDGRCLDAQAWECSQNGGTPQGPGTSCATVNCAQPPPSGTQACCLPDGSCQNLTWVQCKDAGGSPQGAGTSCATTSCPQQPPPPSQTEACCLPDGSCVDTTVADCSARGGSPQGAGTNCAMVNCRGAGPVPPSVKYYLKWSQPPVEIVQAAAHLFNGWDEQSLYGNPPIVADDWACQDRRPITDIHWWGSFLGWTRSDQLPPVVPKAFHIGIWTNVPAGPGQPFSHPGKLIWENYCYNWAWDFAGYDSDPRVSSRRANDACFRFTHLLPEREWFYQEPELTRAGRVYWISIAAIYETGQAPPQYPWGWKTRPHFYSDDAVRIRQVRNLTPGGTQQPTAWPPAIGADWVNGEAVMFGNVSWDMAFELTTNQP